MKIKFKKKFIKHYRKLEQITQSKVDAAISMFRKNPLNPVLKNHALSGNLVGKRSIAAGFDLRLIFVEYEGYVVVEFLDVGTHSQLY